MVVPGFCVILTVIVFGPLLDGTMPFFTPTPPFSNQMLCPGQPLMALQVESRYVQTTVVPRLTLTVACGLSEPGTGPISVRRYPKSKGVHDVDRQKRKFEIVSCSFGAFAAWAAPGTATVTRDASTNPIQSLRMRPPPLSRLNAPNAQRVPWRNRAVTSGSTAFVRQIS